MYKNPLYKRQFCPTPEDIENDRLKKLAKRLEGDSEKETLTNILEWQDTNIQYWWERYPFDILLGILVPFSSVLVLVISLLFLPLLPYTAFASLVVSIVVFFFVVLFFPNITVKVIYLFLFLPIIYIFTSLALRIPVLAKTILPYTLIYVGFLGGIVPIMVHLLVRYRVFLREKPVTEKISKFFEVVDNTFRLSLTVDKILEYKLAVCRDYAKLTASLLFKIYPDSELYFIRIFAHVAVGIKIKNKFYVIDQHLPILTIDNWQIKWNRKTKIYSSRLIRDPRGKTKEVIFNKHVTILRKPKAELPKINAEKLENLTEEIAKTLGMEQISHKDEPNFEIQLSNYAIYYDDDEITKYSLIRAIKNKLECEFCGNMDKISKVSISQNKRDLTMAVWL